LTSSSCPSAGRNLLCPLGEISISNSACVRRLHGQWRGIAILKTIGVLLLVIGVVLWIRGAATSHRWAAPDEHQHCPRSSVIYEFPPCETRYLDERRCPDCNLFTGRIGPGGSCPHCEQPVAISDLIDTLTTSNIR
jgi:hypothetical protein